MIFLSEEQLAEFQRCRKDPVYFLETYGYIRHPVKGRVKLSLFEWQKELLRHMSGWESVLVLKSRQSGFSTVVAGYFLWLTCFHMNMDCYFISRKEDAAISLLRKVKYYADNMPAWLVGEIETNTKTTLSFVFRDDDPQSETYGKAIGESTINSLTTASNAARGESASAVFCDEIAFWPPREAEDIWASVKPATSLGGQIIVGSSPKSGTILERLWYEEVLKPEEERSFHLAKVHYTDSGYDEKWLAHATKGMTKMQILQEFELEFVQSGAPVFDLAALNRCFKPESKFHESSLYFIGIDTAEGRGNDGDYNCAIVLDEHGVQVDHISNREPIGVWAGTIDDNGTVRPGIVSALHDRYPGAMIIEINGPGFHVYEMHQLPNKAWCRVVARRLTAKSKPILLSQLALAVEGGLITITNSELYNQMRIFQHDRNGRMNAPPGAHDDAVIALMWAYEAYKMYGMVSDPSKESDVDMGVGYVMSDERRSYVSLPAFNTDEYVEGGGFFDYKEGRLSERDIR